MTPLALQSCDLSTRLPTKKWKKIPNSLAVQSLCSIFYFITEFYNRWHKQEIEFPSRQIYSFKSQYRVQHVNYHAPTDTENRPGRKRQALSNNNSHLNRSICSPSYDLILNMDKVNYILSGGQRRLAEFQIRGLLTSYNWFSLFDWIRESPGVFSSTSPDKRAFFAMNAIRPKCI